MVPQRRQRSSLAEIREQESWRQGEIFGENVVGSPSLAELREQENDRQAEILGENVVGSQSLVELRNQENQRQAEIFGNNMVVQPKLALTRSALGSLYAMQAEPYDNISIDNGRAASYLNPNPNSFYVPRPATTGYTAIPFYGTPDYSNAYHPIRSYWQTGSAQHIYASVNPIDDRYYPNDSANASTYPSYDQPGVQTNYPMTWPSHDSISSERAQLNHFGPQSLSELQVTSFANTNANFPPQEQDQPGQHQPVQYPQQLPSPFAPTVKHQANSKRATTHWGKLKASSGIVSASQLQPGQSPSKAIEFTKLRSADRVRNVACPICEGTFVTPYQLQAHFPACVKRNGNPDGLFWDETLPPKWRRYGKADTIRSDELN